jgi:hypothetical protein
VTLPSPSRSDLFIIALSSQGGILMSFDHDLDMQFVREFAVGGELVGSSINDRRERIRVAIHRRNLLHMPFRDSGMNYGQAYEFCYRRPIEMRRTPREETPAKPA